MLGLPVLLVLFLTSKEFTVDVDVGSQSCHQIREFGDKSEFILQKNKQTKTLNKINFNLQP